MHAALTILFLLLTPQAQGHPSLPKDGGRAAVQLDYSEFAIDTGSAPVEVGQSRPWTAFDGTNYLVVWQDGRGSDAADIWGARVSAGGTILDSAGFPISAAANAQWSPSVAYLDSTYLVVWYDRRRDGSGDIYGARVTRSGVVLDPDGIRICGVQGAQEFPVVAAGDTCWFVAWQDSRTVWDIRGACVSRSGTVLTPAGVAITCTPSQELYPTVAYNGTNFLVVWQSDQYGPYTLWGARVTQAGQILDPGGFYIAGDISQNVEPAAAAVASTGGGFLVAWQNARTPKHVSAKRVSAAGVPIEPTIPLPEALVWQQNPSVSACGDVYLVSWEDQRNGTWDIYGARISATGVLLDSSAVRVAVAVRDQYDVALAAGEDRWFAAWADKRIDPDQSYVFACAVDTTGAASDSCFRAGTPVRLYCAQLAPAIAAHDSGYIAVWESHAPIGSSSWGTDICGIRLDRDGRALDATAISIAARARDELTPAVACGDSNVLVAWDWYQAGAGVRATRLSYSGRVLDPYWIILTNAGDSPSIAFDGSNYLVVWRENRNVYGSRVTQGGSVLDRIEIAAWTTSDSTPSVAFNGENYLVCWQCGDVVWGTLVSPAGTLINPNGFCVSGTGHRGWAPAVTSNGTDFFVAWMDYRTTWWEIFGTRVSPDGRVLDSAGIMVSRWGYRPYYETDPCVASDGSSFAVLWKSDYDETELHGTMINADGVRTDTFVLSTMPMSSPSPACAYGRDGRFLAVFSAVRDPNSGGRDTLPRIWGSFVSSTTGLAETPAEPEGRAAVSISPNPFGRTARFQLGRGAMRPGASLAICDAAGRCVRAFKFAKTGGLTWDGTDAAGLQLPAGVYFCTLRSGSTIASRNLVKLE